MEATVFEIHCADNSFSGAVWMENFRMKMLRTILLTGFTLATLVFSSASMADHSWGKYKWKPASALDGLVLGDNVDNDNEENPIWGVHLEHAIDDWNGVNLGLITYGIINASVETGTTSGVDCAIDSDNVQVCNADYGNTGWLGIAQIQTSRGTTIVAGLAKLNDYYFDSAPYNTSEWRQMVMCQEIAHTFGLDHQDETFSNANLGTCMDYTNNPLGPPSNVHPNQHDFDQLEAIYGGGDGGGGGCNPKSPKCNSATAAGGHAEFGQLVSGHGGIEVFEKNLGNGRKLVTQVTWTLEYASNHRH
jgi:hypothetical protein